MQSFWRLDLLVFGMRDVQKLLKEAHFENLQILRQKARAETITKIFIVIQILYYYIAINCNLCYEELKKFIIFIEKNFD